MFRKSNIESQTTKICSANRPQRAKTNKYTFKKWTLTNYEQKNVQEVDPRTPPTKNKTKYVQDMDPRKAITKTNMRNKWTLEK